MPVDKTETIPVDAVRSGDPLLFDQGEGDELLWVENVSYDHDHVNNTTTYTLTLMSGPDADSGEPWVVELAGGAPVRRMLR